MDDKSIITEKDVLILKKLLEDGRKSSASISKEIDLGREIVNYRIKRLIKENLIVKFVPRINEKAMNYQEYIIFLKLNLDDEISREKFVRENIGNKYLLWSIKSESGWDLIVRLYAQSVEEFKEKLQEILDNFSDVLTSYYTIISSEEIKENEKEILSEKLFQENIKKDFKIIKKTDHSVLHIDEKDREIIRLLENDARTQYKEIADKLNISSDTVKYRIDKLKEQGVIEKFAPIINFNKLGLIQYATIVNFNFLDKKNEEKLNKVIQESSYITRAIRSLNSQEYFMTLIFQREKDATIFEEEFTKEFKDKIDTFEMFKID